MSRFLHAFVFMSCMAVTACNSNNSAGEAEIVPDSPRHDGTLQQDTEMIIVDTSTAKPVSTRAPEGVYQSTLSQGRRHTVAFYPDHTYRLEEEQGKNTTRSRGTWKPTNGTIYLYRDQLLAGQYRWRDDTLLYLSGRTEMPLGKLTSAEQNDVWRKKGGQGLEFFGVGNEPFWNIEVDEQKHIAFHLADWEKPIRFKPSRRVTSGDSIVYNTSNDTATLSLTIYNRFCSDGMSDYIYPNKVKVIFKNQVFEGCGLVYR
ncbi:MAG TPA: hypothetical protein VGB46_10260 [Flavisolibacter sp.]